MTRNDIAKLSFKLLAVYFIIQLLYQTQDILWYLFFNDGMQQPLRTQYIASILPSILIFLTGIILWFIAPYLANTIFNPRQDEEKMRVSIESFHSVAISLGGLFVFVRSFSGIIEYIVFQGYMASSTGKYRLNSAIVAAGVQMIFGLWLILGSKGIVKGIRAIRRPRIPPDSF